MEGKSFNGPNSSVDVEGWEEKLVSVYKPPPRTLCFRIPLTGLSGDWPGDCYVTARLLFPMLSLWDWDVIRFRDNALTLSRCDLAFHRFTH